MEADDISRRLDAVDWDFPRGGTSLTSPNSLHWYPGNFIPQIPSFLITLLSSPGDTVWDPCCGGGTTGVEALLLGRRALLSDALKAAVHVSTGKLSLFSARPEVLEKFLEPLMWGRLLFPCSATPDLPSADLEHWFHPDTQVELASLWSRVQQCDGPERIVLEMLFTDVLFRCAAAEPIRRENRAVRRHHWGWIADNVRPQVRSRHDAIRLMADAVARAISVLRQLPRIPKDYWSCEQHDARQSRASVVADLVVLSPPYQGMIDYSLANRLSYQWMNWELAVDRQAEIGARRARERKGTLEQYFSDMDAIGEAILHGVKPGGFIAIVLGASRKFPGAEHVVFDRWARLFPIFWGPRARAPSRQRVSDRSATASTEYVCIFRRN
jgi:hypothetical protein